MARPIKKGLDYFPFDVNFFEDEKISAISGEFQLKGEIIVVKLLCAIYRNGYYYEWNEMNKMYLLKQLSGISVNLLDEVINRLVRWGFFDKSLFDSSCILTSVGIQERYFSAISRRKISKEYSYLLISVSNNEVNVNINTSQEELMFTKNTQTKRKEIKTPLTSPTSGDSKQGFSSEGGKFIPPDDGIKRNYEGLLRWMEDNHVPVGIQHQIVWYSNYGAINDPVWKFIAEIDRLKGKIKMPGSFLLSRLRNQSTIENCIKK